MSGHLHAAPEPSATVRTPGKVNLVLRSGAVRDDGYHPLSTVFQAVSLFEEVTATHVAPGAGISLTVSGPQADVVPLDETNLAWRAALAVADHTGMDADVALHIHKGVPVAGGMAGGSADAAAALVACDALWDAGLSRQELTMLGARLGADVPFALLGHTAVGTGRGDVLTPVLARGEFHWAFAVQAEGLPTPSVFARFDELSADDPAHSPDPGDDAGLMAALRAGDPTALGEALHNDLQAAAVDLRPELGRVMEVAREAGTLGTLVSGSGPTVAALARTRRHALAIAAAWTAAGVADSVWTATGPAPGARLTG
ncbi:4-(cytidine 5'-diphospho)-2-C-methyl-D-erythritol kinase [Myceligenerans pegani]|uniref:4-diphosphocytidyl-2-C-methyl-D-erythritol kinase n=1 Tax=Myceligenerans pegani TaxID=2776917 RepID=A0ABR9MV28_9MICO|nr:4-(cytidine 5'-diphospho)-2-C-methyl-D-erythritol kinase [Myceligenerans sp. TRM 65318]MBE1874627.1 4-(cytidine 5'-diphospho)-2-C-methyl-D-erythritol kinase [Myceligenerans sp. TRM 65318]MBE3016898.1 4-(cytidine 5'-diphospho)-2-C-methyl-D-erythritol kinase [Myceligenerans sp. TRM 65318]